MPLIVVLPGIAAVILAPDLASPDQAYPEMMKLMPVGLLGLVFAALLAAIVSSLGSMVNSISTIFTLDLYSFYRKGRSEEQLVRVGRITSIIALILAMISARPLLGNFDQAFQYIQEFTGFFTPGIVVVFLLGLFWPKASTAGALAAAIGSAVFSIALKIFWPSLPFMDRVGLVFVICLAAAVIISLMQKNQEQSHGISTEGIDFSTTKSFNYSALAVVVILCGLYAVWW
jgi:SSS family solute:Na+ symporter